MFGNTLELPQGASSVTLVKVDSSDRYSSEYLFKGTLSEHRVRIRHSKTKAKNGQPSKDRHNVEVVETVYATAEAPEFSRKVYVVFEQLPSDNDTTNVDGLADWLISGTVLASLMGWES
jgi:hypothetical protein